MNKKKALLIVIDNDSYIHYFPLGTAYIASALQEVGVEVEIYNQDINHYNEKHLTSFLNQRYFDIVSIGTVAGYYPYKKLLKIAEAINASTNRNDMHFIIGGHMVSASPEYILRRTKADFAILGEGEETVKELVRTKFSKQNTEGTVRRISEEFFWGGSRPQILDLENISRPAYDLFPIEYYRLQRLPNIDISEFSMSMITGRGCTYHCTFCYRLMEGIRLRKIESIIEEIKYLKDKWNISYIDFADDLTMSTKNRAIELSEALTPLNIKWRCEGRLNYADRNVLRIMKKAGCVFINYGIESLTNNVLKLMKKGLTEDIIMEGVENTLNIGISPGLNIIWGNKKDDLNTLEKSVKFLLKYDNFSQIRNISFVTPYPGTELFNEAIRLGYLKDVEDFYENKHKNSDLLTINFMNISDEEAYSALYSANSILLNNYYKNKMLSIKKQLKKLYLEKDINFRGFRHT